MRSDPVRLAVTLGDPRGIGPEIVGAVRSDAALAALADLVVVGPEGTGTSVDEPVGAWPPLGGDADPAAAAGRLAGRAIERAVELAQSGLVDGIVTAPIDKAALLAGGYDYPGHTEMLAALTGSQVAMMLASSDAGEGSTHPLRVILATTHIPLRAVPDAVTVGAIERAAEVTHRGLVEWFGIASPRIALCALNPHAGDGGRFGTEDDTVLRPAARRAGIAGPYPADTVFVRALRGEFDAVIAPYHDVGMTAIKVAAFGRAVNVTLGLPFPRTSPDHGTAIDIAGRGIADASSMKESVRVCARIVRRLSTAARTRPTRSGDRSSRAP
ncbi:MAG TPA: 4-hydroxythreonine-4-phosphate dehydrogenase PdxA [Gemmatimonadaceae bacterium]|nr:4-hydroxythreonine-4-phosphate dehydrogenase PdxA [Gemmatimonadaceae bacterium]